MRRVPDGGALLLLILLSRTTWPQRSESSLISAPSCAGVMVRTSWPRPVILSRISGVARMALISVLRRLTISGGVPAVVMKPNQVSAA